MAGPQAKRKKKPEKYYLVMYLRAEYKKEGRKHSYYIYSNNLEKLLKLFERHTKNYKRNPWEYAGIYKRDLAHCSSDSLFFINVRK